MRKLKVIRPQYLDVFNLTEHEEIPLSDQRSMIMLREHEYAPIRKMDYHLAMRHIAERYGLVAVLVHEKIVVDGIVLHPVVLVHTSLKFSHFGPLPDTK